MRKCFICRDILTKAFDLGDIYQSTFISPGMPMPNKSALCLSQCLSCGLVQLEQITDPDSSYRQYWYRSSLNVSMVKSLANIVEGIEKRIVLSDDDVVIDIGCNDGTLLDLYTNKNLFKVGFDPALNLKVYAEKASNLFVNDYYRKCTINGKNAQAKVITAIAMFYDLENPHQFLKDVKQNLAEDGVFVVQMTDLLSMLKVNAFDNICHEHLEVYTLRVFNNLLDSHDLQIFDVEYNDVNGGSVRAYIGFKDSREVSKAVAEALQAEDAFFSLPENSFPEFKARIDRYKKTVVEFIEAQNAKGKKVFGMGASTKGNTLLQYYGIDHTMVPYVSEVNSDKFGLRTVGTNIEIISEKDALEKKPDFFLVLPWHFRDGLVKKSKDFLEAGGGLIFPLPEPELVTKDGVVKL